MTVININPDMIKIAREARGYTQSSLAAAIPSLAQSNLSKIEKALIGTSEEVINQIANVLDFPKSFFYDRYTFPPFSNVYYRKSITSSIKKTIQIEAIFKTTMFAVDSLLDSVEISEFSIPEIDIENGISPTDAARIVRYKLGLAEGKIDDIVEVLEKNGIIVIEIDTDFEKFAGMSTITQNRQLIIFINANMPNDRKRLTIAHELGHIVMHIPFPFRDANRDIEKEAFLFAGEFLMPYKLFRQEVYPSLSYKQLDILKSYWKTSKQAIIRKAFNDRIIDDNRYKSLMVQLSMNGERKVERGAVDFQAPKLLEKIIDVFYTDFEYTKEELTNAIKVNLDTLPFAFIKKHPSNVVKFKRFVGV